MNLTYGKSDKVIGLIKKIANKLNMQDYLDFRCFIRYKKKFIKLNIDDLI